MKRFASIDFLRGLALLIMLILHTTTYALDVDQLTNNLGSIALMNYIIIIVFNFFGGLAGLFLMVSATGNMISMMKNYQKGISNKDILYKQVVGGILLLIFGMLTEGVIGYQGTLGEFFLHMGVISQAKWSAYVLDLTLWRGWHIETIHTIAWCMIVNGIVQGILCSHDNWKNPKRLVKIYAILAILVLVVTFPIWQLVQNAMGGQLPYMSDTAYAANLSNYYPVLGKASFGDILRAFVLDPLGGDPEPIFPYLAASFIGSIVGLFLTQNESRPTLRDLKRLAYLGLGMFFVGLIGVIYEILSVLIQFNFDAGIQVLGNLWNFRWWVIFPANPDGSYPGGILDNVGWLFSFLMLNGFSLLLICLVIRIAEFRGQAENFAKKTAFVRRFGTIAFTIYCFQFLYYFIIAALGLVYNPYHLLIDGGFNGGFPYFDWTGCVIVIVLNLLLWEGLMKLWEKVGYAGSLEYWIGTFGSLLIPVKRAQKSENRTDLKWYQIGKIDVQRTFYDAEWVNLITLDEIDHANFQESRVVFRLAILGLIFFPFDVFAWGMCKRSFETEQINKYNRRARIILIIGLVFAAIWITLGFALNMAILGVNLS